MGQTKKNLLHQLTGKKWKRCRNLRKKNKKGKPWKIYWMLQNKKTCQASIDIFTDKLWGKKKDRKAQMLKKKHLKKRLKKKQTKLKLRRTNPVKDPIGKDEILNQWRIILITKISLEIRRQRAAVMMKSHKKLP